MKQKGFAPIIIILGIVLLLGIVGGAYYFGKISNKPIPTLQSSSTPSAIITDETAEWGTYVNKTYNFIVKVPPELGYQGEDYSVDFYENTNPAFSVKYRIQVNQTKRDFEKIYQVPNNSIIPEEAHTLGATFRKKENLLVDNVKAISFEYKASGDQTEENSIHGVIVNKDSLLIEFIIRGKSRYNAPVWYDLNEFNLMLSTFKFTDQEYMVSGNLTKEASEKDIGALRQAVSKQVVSFGLLEKFPPGFQITTKDKNSCEEVRKILSGYKFVDGFGDCQLRATPINPDQSVSSR